MAHWSRGMIRSCCLMVPSCLSAPATCSFSKLPSAPGGSFLPRKGVQLRGADLRGKIYAAFWLCRQGQELASVELVHGNSESAAQPHGDGRQKESFAISCARFETEPQT